MARKKNDESDEVRDVENSDAEARDVDVLDDGDGEDQASPREGTSGTDVNRIGPRA